MNRDGATRDSEGREPTAHEILESHVTNVSEVTAKVIRRAVREYNAIEVLKVEPILQKLDDLRVQLAELTVTVNLLAAQQQKDNGSAR